MRAAALAWLTTRGLLAPLLAFVAMAAVVYLSGSRLTRHADTIAETSALGRLWIGTLLLAAATSLPELTTDLYAAALRAPNLGIGDLMGSSLANMLILALLDLIYFRRRVLDSISRNHLMVGALAIILTALAGTEIASGGSARLGRTNWPPAPPSAATRSTCASCSRRNRPHPPGLCCARQPGQISSARSSPSLPQHGCCCAFSPRAAARSGARGPRVCWSCLPLARPSGCSRRAEGAARIRAVRR